MNESEKPAANDFELKGIARFSFRLRLLKKLAASDDPIISATATSLIRDRIARNFGLAFEFIFLVYFTISQILYVIWFFENLNINTFGALQATQGQMHVMPIWHIYCRMLPWYIGYACGSIVLLWPGISLLRKESKEDWFRFVPLDNGSIFNSILLVQSVSFMFYPAIAIILSVIVSLCTNYYYLHLTMNTDFYIWSNLCYFTTRMLFIIYVTVASISSGIKWSNIWGAISQFILMLVAYYLAMRLGKGMLDEMKFSEFFNNFQADWWMYDLVPPLVAFLICTPVTVFLAKTAILARIMPRK